jgi:hypothetical protein
MKALLYMLVYLIRFTHWIAKKQGYTMATQIFQVKNMKYKWRPRIGFANPDDPDTSYYIWHASKEIELFSK